MNNQFVESTVSIMSHSLAPVFMLTAIGGIMACMSNRYGRVIDRTRTLLREGDRLYGRFASHDHVRKEVFALYRRAKILRNALVLAAFAIVFVVGTVLISFLELKYNLSIGYFTEYSFLLSLGILSLSVLLFIRDFVISLNTLKLDIHTRGDDSFFGEA